MVTMPNKSTNRGKHNKNLTNSWGTEGLSRASIWADLLLVIVSYLCVQGCSEDCWVF